MTEYQIQFKRALIALGWSEKDADDLARSEFVYRCVCQGETPESAAQSQEANR